MCCEWPVQRQWPLVALQVEGEKGGSMVRTPPRARYWRIDLDEHICSRINQSIATDCRTFRPLSTVYKTEDTAV